MTASDAPLVSVCMPCFNAARTLADSIESVLSQSWHNLELIIADDGSSDNSLEVARRYSSSRVKVLSLAHGGQCVAANEAFAASCGQYVKFMDADDLLSPGFIEAQVLRLGGRVDAVASSRWGRFYGDDLSTFVLNPQPVWRDMSSVDWLVEAWKDAQPMMQCALWLIPRCVFNSSGLWDPSLTLINDFEFFSRVLCSVKDVLFVPEATLFYRSGVGGSLSSQKSPVHQLSAYRSLCLGTECVLRLRSDPDALRSCANVMQGFVYGVYPLHRKLRRSMSSRIKSMGGSDLRPFAGPRFSKLQRVVGWRLATRFRLLLAGSLSAFC